MNLFFARCAKNFLINYKFQFNYESERERAKKSAGKGESKQKFIWRRKPEVFSHFSEFLCFLCVGWGLIGRLN